MHASPGGKLDQLISLDEGVICVFTRKQQLRRAQELVRSHVPASRSLADELIAERRKEAERD
jgi:hypothetical protein